VLARAWAQRKEEGGRRKEEGGRVRGKATTCERQNLARLQTERAQTESTYRDHTQNRRVLPGPLRPEACTGVAAMRPRTPPTPTYMHAHAAHVRNGFSFQRANVRIACFLCFSIPLHPRKMRHVKLYGPSRQRRHMLPCMVSKGFRV
jgi:hypothetical protein